MKATVKIEKVNYFGERTGTHDFNAKVLYRKNGKLYLAHIYIDFFNKSIYEGKGNYKESKILKGFLAEIKDYAEKTNWFFQ